MPTLRSSHISNSKPPSGVDVPAPSASATSTTPTIIADHDLHAASLRLNSHSNRFHLDSPPFRTLFLTPRTNPTLPNRDEVMHSWIFVQNQNAVHEKLQLDFGIPVNGLQIGGVIHDGVIHTKGYVAVDAQGGEVGGEYRFIFQGFPEKGCGIEWWAQEMIDGAILRSVAGNYAARVASGVRVEPAFGADAVVVVAESNELVALAVTAAADTAVDTADAGITATAEQKMKKKNEAGSSIWRQGFETTTEPPSKEFVIEMKASRTRSGR